VFAALQNFNDMLSICAIKKATALGIDLWRLDFAVVVIIIIINIVITITIGQQDTN